MLDFQAQEERPILSFVSAFMDQTMLTQTGEENLYLDY